jgi:DNA-binding GntR family transcriptional regulator
MARKQKRTGPIPEIDHTQKAYMGIRRMLFHNEIGPGQKISYRDLAERLKMSSTPVIQALKQLEFQGLVRHEPNRGYYTESISIQEVKEIYELREVIELSLLPETIQNLSEKGIRQLRDVFQAHLKTPDDLYLNDRLIKDMDFHLTLASLSGRQIQLQVLRNLFDLLYLKYSGTLLFIRSKIIVGSEHQNIFDSVISRDLEKAQNALGQHFSNVKNHVLAALGQMFAEKEVSGF